MSRAIVREKQLIERNIVTPDPDGGSKGAYAKIKHLQERYAFPEGFMLTDNARAWFLDDIDAWVAQRAAEGHE